MKEPDYVIYPAEKLSHLSFNIINWNDMKIHEECSTRSKVAIVRKRMTWWTLKKINSRINWIDIENLFWSVQKLKDCLSEKEKMKILLEIFEGEGTVVRYLYYVYP